MLVILLLLFAVLTILLIPFIVKEHKAARSRDNWRKATNSPIIKDNKTKHNFIYPVHGSRNISLDSPPEYNNPKNK
tara:strand:- start:23 stop:250 length:228 start_codon:yes stop_codon:yes gene_type:complete